MSNIVVGLDLSLTASGIAVIDSSPVSAMTRVIPSGRRAGQTLLDLDQRISGVVQAVMDYADKADLVVLEGPSYGSKDPGVWDRAHLWWSVVHRIHSHEIPLVIVPPTVVKKWATGKGGASKVAVGIAVGRLWPDVDIDDDNAADALALATIGAQRLGLVDALVRHRATVAVLDWPESLHITEQRNAS